MVQALHLSNGDTLNEKLSDEKSIVASLIAAGGSDEEMLEKAYLTTLARMPTAEESSRLRELMKNSDAGGKRLVLEDLFWALMTSREFLFQH